MATSSRTPLLLNDMLQWGICLEQMNEQPQHILKLLLCCQQTVCVRCVANLNACPFCHTDLPQDLQTNHTIIQIGDLVKTSKYGGMNKNVCFVTHRIKRYVCIVNSVMIIFVSNLALCGRKHEENVLFKEHTLAMVTSNISICNTHNRALTIYCVDCNVLLCILCEHQNSCCANKNTKIVEDNHQEKSQMKNNL